MAIPSVDAVWQMIKTSQNLAVPPQIVNGNGAVFATLLDSHMELEGLIPWSSNYTFLVSLTAPQPCLAVYKPQRGERPLWDFPPGTLHQREFLSYLLSQVLGWPKIPPTVLRDGPHGEGSVQLFIEADIEAHYFTLRDDPALTTEFERLALFDLITNNADRKGGHCLKDKNEQIWAIDHGLTFHAEFKLRTVIWEFCNKAISSALLQDLERLQNLLIPATALSQILAQFLTLREREALSNRIKALLESRHYPMLQPFNVPYPPV